MIPKKERESYQYWKRLDLNYVIIPQAHFTDEELAPKSGIQTAQSPLIIEVKAGPIGKLRLFNS